MEGTVVSEIVCQKIRLVNSQGDTVAVLGTEETEETESPTPIFHMYNAEGLAALELGVDSQGAGSVVIFNKHEKPAVAVQVASDDDSGQIVVHNRHSEIAVLVDASHINEDSGSITVVRDKKIMARVYSNADGGSVSVHSPKDARSGVTVGVASDDDSGEIIVWREGEIMARVRSDADGGSVSVNSTKDVIAFHVYAATDGGNLVVRGDWGTAVHLYSDNEGGQVALINKDGHSAVLAGTDADGDGTVLTLADGNVTSRMPRGGR